MKEQFFLSRTKISMRAACLSLVSLALFPAMLNAQPIATTAGDDIAPAKAFADLGIEVQDQTAQLSLEDAIIAALRRNLQLVVERYRRSQSLQGIDEALGIYDLNLGADSTISENSSPPSSTLEEALVLEDEDASANFNISQLNPFGGTSRIDFRNRRFASSNLNVQPNPRFSASLGLRYDQPLLRGFGRTATAQRLLIARNNGAASFEDFQSQVESIIQQVADGYWSLVEAREQLEVAVESLQLAERLHEMNKIQVEVGTMAPLETVQSEAGVATREEEIIQRRAAVEDSADELRRLVNLDLRELWNYELLPTTPSAIEHQAIDIDEAVDVALENRPEVRRQRLQIKNREIDAKVARNGKKPRLDLTATFGYNAVAGDESDRSTGELLEPGDYGDAIQQIYDADFDGWSVGLTFAYPLQNRAAKARSVTADLAVEQSDIELRNLEQQIFAEVRRSARAVETAAKQIESAKVSSRLAQENLDAEEKRYENGLSTSFQVLEIQEDLSQAKSREVSAVITYRRALTAFQRSIGRLLDAHGVELALEETRE